MSEDKWGFEELSRKVEKMLTAQPENELPFIQVYADELAVETEYHDGKKILNVAVYGKDILEQVVNQFSPEEILELIDTGAIEEYLSE